MTGIRRMSDSFEYVIVVVLTVIAIALVTFDVVMFARAF